MKNKTNLSAFYVVVLIFSVKFLVSCDGGIGGGISGAIGFGMSGMIGTFDVRDSSSNGGLDGITVTFMDSNKTTIFTATTNSNGTFSINESDLPPGTYTVVPFKARFQFEPAQQEIVKIQDTPISLSFTAISIPYIRGQVNDINGNPVLGMQVQLSGQGVAVSPSGGPSVSLGDDVAIVIGGDDNGDGISISVTDSDGRFKFYGLPTNTNSLTVTPAITEYDFAPQMIDATTDPIVLNFTIDVDQFEIPTKIVRNDYPPPGFDPPALFGNTVSMSADGKTMIVGSAPDAIHFPLRTKGNLFAYQFINGSWKQSKISSMFGNGQTLFGTMAALSAQGDMIIVGDPPILHIYYWNGSSWYEFTQKQIPGMSYFYPKSLTISNDGSTIVIGAPETYEVYIFERNGLDWNLQKVLNSSQQDRNYFPFGISVSISGDGTRLVASNNYDYQIYHRNDTDWNLIATIQADTNFGYGNPFPVFPAQRAVISANGDDVFIGRVQYQWTGSEWLPFSNLPIDNSPLNSSSSNPDDNKARVVSADASVYFMGRYIYKWNGTGWDITSMDPLQYGAFPFNNEFVGDVSITPDGSSALIGCPEDFIKWPRSLGLEAGAAFRIPLQ